MTVTCAKNNSHLLITITGRLDTKTVADFDRQIASDLATAEEVTLDLKDLEYVSSAGLRALLRIHMAVGGNVKAINANELVKEVFSVTGFQDFFSIE